MLNVPVHLSSAFKQQDIGVHKGYEYARSGNPTREALEKLICELECGYQGFAFASGMAATTAVLMLFKSGDKILLSNNVYGGSFRVLDKVFKQFQLDYELVDTSNLELIAKKITPSVKAIFIETPTNPLMGISDIFEIAQLAKKHNIISIVDNTFMTPYLQQPIKLGADIVLHSATKYLGGHSDLIAGLAIVNNSELAQKLGFIQNATGGVLGPFDSWLVIRGIKTFALRMDCHIANAKHIISKLKVNPAGTKIYYPGLTDHPNHELHRKQATGDGGVISFILAEKYNVNKFFTSLKLITLAESLGGVESLISHPASMTHAAIPENIRLDLGIVPNLIRLSVGIESANDLAFDLEQAFVASEIK